jgi:putative effector of murein hydrolase LrgA (UPF0299 family)
VIRAFGILLGFELLGEALRAAARLPVPGPVIGMLALAAVLVAWPGGVSPSAGEPRAETELERVCHGLISHMGLLFVPAGVGVITEAAVLKAQWLPILVGVLGSTLVGLAVTALVMQHTLPAAEAVPDAAPDAALGEALTAEGRP